MWLGGSAAHLASLMLPGTWQTPRLNVRDATPSELGLCHACLVDSQDAAPLDLAFKLVPPAEIQEHITRSASEPGAHATRAAARGVRSPPAEQLSIILSRRLPARNGSFRDSDALTPPVTPA